MQGDVIQLRNASTGALVAKYEYDAWGNHKVLNPNGTENTDEYFVGNINPIRYRSYYYDREIKLYYLQTRWYDPETGRFINLDQIEYLDPEAVNGLNLYAYCGNNPVMNTDPDGTWAFWDDLFALISGAVIGFVGQLVSDVVTSVITGEFELSNWQTYVGATVGGAVGGLASLYVGPSAAGAISGGVTTFVGMSLEKITGANDRSWGEIMFNTGLDFVVGGVLGKISSKIFPTGTSNGFKDSLFKNSLAKSGKEMITDIVNSFTNSVLMDIYYGVKMPLFKSLGVIE